MKINKYLFIIILIVILCVLFYCFYNTSLENMEDSEDKQKTEEVEEEEEDPELKKKQLNLQEVVNKFSGSLYKQIRDMIYSQTEESKKEIDNIIKQNSEIVNEIESEGNNIDDELEQKIGKLINMIDMDLGKTDAALQFNSKEGVTIEIEEQDKIRSIVNKYLTQ